MPSPFTGYSFHVVEALIVFGNEVIVCFLFPIHMGLHRIYHIATTIIHEGEQRSSVGQLGCVWGGGCSAWLSCLAAQRPAGRPLWGAPAASVPGSPRRAAVAGCTLPAPATGGLLSSA